MSVAGGVVVRPTGVAYELATTQEHHAIDTVGFEEIGRRVGELESDGLHGNSLAGTSSDCFVVCDWRRYE